MCAYIHVYIHMYALYIYTCMYNVYLTSYFLFILPNAHLYVPQLFTLKKLFKFNDIVRVLAYTSGGLGS